VLFIEKQWKAAITNTVYERREGERERIELIYEDTPHILIIQGHSVKHKGNDLFVPNILKYLPNSIKDIFAENEADVYSSIYENLTHHGIKTRQYRQQSTLHYCHLVSHQQPVQ
jgi:hypothetical protein